MNTPAYLEFRKAFCLESLRLIELRFDLELSEVRKAMLLIDATRLYDEFEKLHSTSAWTPRFLSGALCDKIIEKYLGVGI